MQFEVDGIVYVKPTFRDAFLEGRYVATISMFQFIDPLKDEATWEHREAARWYVGDSDVES